MTGPKAKLSLVTTWASTVATQPPARLLRQMSSQLSSVLPPSIVPVSRDAGLSPWSTQISCLFTLLVKFCAH